MSSPAPQTPPTDALRGALRDTIRQALIGELDVPEPKFNALVAAWRATRDTSYDEWVGREVVVSPVHAGWQTIGRLVGITDQTLELTDAAPVRWPEIEWGRQLIPLSTVASIRLAETAQPKENDQ